MVPSERPSVQERLNGYRHPAVQRLYTEELSEPAFWRDIERVGAPLIEADNDPDWQRVTFIWKLDSGAEHVVLLLGGFPDAPDHLLDRVPGTTTCHATYRLRSDMVARYSFVQDMPLIAWRDADPDQADELNAFIRRHLTHSEPFNPHVINTLGLARGNRNSLLMLDTTPSATLAEKRPGVERGYIHTERFASSELGDERDVYVYTTPGFQEHRDAGNAKLLLVLDGAWYLSLIPTQHILDNLHAEGVIGPLVACFIDNATPTSRDTELPCNPAFADFVEGQLLPWLRGHYAHSQQPADVAVAGSSFGGLGACWLGYQLSHLIGNVIAQASAFWWAPDYRQHRPGSPLPDGVEWLTKQFASTDRLPLSFWVEVGLLEDFPSMVAPNRSMARTLQEKGYPLSYHEYAGGHDHALWRWSLSEALQHVCSSRE